jgi:hypothetical protein
MRPGEQSSSKSVGVTVAVGVVNMGGLEVHHSSHLLCKLLRRYVTSSLCLHETVLNF